MTEQATSLRLSSLMNAVTTETGHMLKLLAQNIRKGEVDLLQGDAFKSACEQMIAAFSGKVRQILYAALISRTPHNTCSPFR